MSNTYDRGGKVRVFGTFRSTAGVPTNPTVVRLKYRQPGSTMTTLTHSTATSVITRVSAGVYRSDIIPDKEGVWTYQFDSSGAIRASAEKQFRVRSGLV